MTGEMRNSSSSYRGRNILVKDRLFMEVRLVCAVKITLIAPSTAPVTTLIFMSSSGPGQKMSVDQFQNKLPKVVIKAGRVIDIRGSLRDILQVRICPSFLSVICGTCALTKV